MIDFGFKKLKVKVIWLEIGLNLGLSKSGGHDDFEAHYLLTDQTLL